MNDAARHERTVVIGASVRAAARSVRRAGSAVAAIDRFGDRDLAEIAKPSAVVVADWPSAVPAVLTLWPPWPVCYLGGLENHPALLERIAARHPLWGNPASVVRMVRDPFRLAQELGREGINVPALNDSARSLPTDGTWLEKPLASAGGLGIRRWDPAARERPAAEPVLYQRWVPGRAIGASFVAGADSCSTLIGVCRSWRGGSAGPFAYRGSLGPVALAPRTRSNVARIGAIVASRFGLRGLFGIDLIRDSAGQLHVLEVNPRMTASMEVLERANGQRLFLAHARAFDPAQRSGPGSSSGTMEPAGVRLVGKAVVYAPADLRVPDVDPPAVEAALRQARQVDGQPKLADLPWPGTLIARGEPVCTVFAQGSTDAELRDRLRRRVLVWTGRLERSTWSGAY